MKKTTLLLLLGLGLLTGCQKKEDVGPDDFLETDARLVNNLPVDGCEWHLTVQMGNDEKFFVPNQETAYRVEAIIITLPVTGGVITEAVRMKYRLTGKKREVQCGFGRTNTYDAIEVLEIKKR